MPTVGFPSDDFPALSGFTIEIPEGWVADPYAGLHFAARPAATVEGFMPNLVASVKRRPAADMLANAKAEFDRGAQEMGEYAEIGRSDMNGPSHRGFHVEYTYRHASQLTLAQMVTLVEVERGPVSDLIQLTATCAGEQARARWDEFRAMQASLKVLLPTDV